MSQEGCEGDPQGPHPRCRVPPAGDRDHDEAGPPQHRKALCCLRGPGMEIRMRSIAQQNRNMSCTILYHFIACHIHVISAVEFDICVCKSSGRDRSSSQSSEAGSLQPLLGHGALRGRRALRPLGRGEAPHRAGGEEGHETGLGAKQHSVEPAFL